MIQNLVTIIIPAYNEEERLKRCLDSIVNQTYKNLEVFVVDDGSKDGTYKIAKEYEKDNRFIVLQKENRGLSSARNFALDRFNGDYVYFLDADDYLYPTSIEYLLGVLQSAEADMVWSLTNRKNANPMVLDSPISTKTKDEAIMSYFKGEHFSESCCAKLYKRFYFEKLRFEEGRIHEDAFMTYQLLDITNKVAVTNFNGYISEIREDSITHAKFGNKNYDNVIANKRICDFYKGTKYEKLAYQKYIGTLLFFILKTNKIDGASCNEVARKELHEAINKNGFKNLKVKFIPMIILERIGLLKYIGYR